MMHGLADVKRIVVFVFFYYKQQTHNYIITVYITTVSLCILHCYVFRHCRIIIMEFTTNALLSYTRYDDDRKMWKHVAV